MKIPLPPQLRRKEKNKNEIHWVCLKKKKKARLAQSKTEISGRVTILEHAWVL